MSDKLIDQIEEESDVRAEGHTITAEYTIDLPRDLVDEVQEEYDYKDAGVRCAKSVARRRFKRDHDVAFNDPSLIAEADGMGFEPDQVRFKVVATK